MEICRITVPLDPAPLSPNRMNGRHWRSATILKAKARDAAQWAWYSAGRQRARVPVIVSVIVRRGRVLDDDNLKASLKCVIDALFKGAVTPDDSLKYFELGALKQETGKIWKGREEIVFIVNSRDQLPLQES